MNEDGHLKLNYFSLGFFGTGQGDKLLSLLNTTTVFAYNPNLKKQGEMGREGGVCKLSCLVVIERYKFQGLIFFILLILLLFNIDPI